MNEEQRILLEQYLTFDMMDFEQGMTYLKFLLNMRDLKTPLLRTDEFIKTELVMLSLKQEKESVYFSGAYTLINEGESENRSITGHIYNEKGKIIFDMDVYRLGDIEEDKEYNVCEMFTPNRDKKTHKRFTSYKSGQAIQNFLEPRYTLKDKELEEFINQKTNMSKSK